MFGSFTIRATAMLLTVALAGAAWAGDDDDFDGLTALQQGFANPMPTMDPCVLNNEVTATGLAVDIGRYDYVSTEVANLLSPNPDCSAPDGAEIKGEFEITTESGDQIFGAFKAVARIDLSMNEITARGRYRITGGAGEFEDWEGRGTTALTGSFGPPFDVTGQFIAQPGPDDD